MVRDLYNTSLVEGAIPCAWKQSIVVPLRKVNPPKVLEEDLRPISLTGLLAKIIEGFTHDSLARQVLGQLDTKQFCVKEKCTTHALVYLFHSILHFLDRGNTSIRIFFAEFSKGFELVDHNVLLEELQVLNVHPSIIRWIGASLSERSQRVRVGKSLSPPVSLHGGIPRGTKLAPLLFAILVNRLDDTTVFEAIPRCSPSYLPLIVNDISCFSSLRGMHLNPKDVRLWILISSNTSLVPRPLLPSMAALSIRCRRTSSLESMFLTIYHEHACRAHSHQSL